MKLTKKQINNIIFFVLLAISIISIAFIYRFDKVATLPPQSLHAWRQTDCASQALNYYQHGMNFFKPELHSMIADNGTSGYSVEEFPIFFYTVAFLYKIFGYHPAVYRLFTFLFFIIAIYACSLFFNLFWKNKLSSALAALLLFTSTTMAFYSINYICNIPSIAIMLVAWFFFFCFYFDSDKKYYLLLSLILFGIATLLKVSEGLSFCALGCIWLIERLKIYRFGKDGKALIPNWISYVFALVGIIIFAWYKWAHIYNLQHQQIYYSFQIKPIWILDASVIKGIFNVMVNRWLFDYFTIYVYGVICVSIVVVIIFWRRCNPLLKTITLLLFLGSFLYIMLFFINMKDHDYYMLSTYISFWFAILTAGEFLIRTYSKKVSNIIILVLAVVLLLSVPVAYKHLKQRYFGWEWEFPRTSEYKAFYNIDKELDKMGIQKNDKVISLPDFSICYTLYLMNRQGWTGFSKYDSVTIDDYIKKGAKYLVINGYNTVSKDCLKSYIQQPVGKIDSIYVFKLSQNTK